MGSNERRGDYMFNSKTRLLVLIATFSILTATWSAAQKSGRSGGVNVRSTGRMVTSCNDLDIQFDREPAIVVEEQRTIPRAAVASLSAQAPANGGIYVQGGTGDEYLIKACKAVRRDEGSVAAGLSLSTSGGRVTVDGPRNEDWVAYLIIETPRNASVDLEARNGPISISGVSGRIRAHAINGPISVRNVEGEGDIETQNGPITFEGGKGRHRLIAANGPIHVGLTGSQWDGQGLDVQTQNGPLTLDIPQSYSSAVRVDVSASSPVRCVASQCQQAIRTWADPDRISIGNGNPVVRLTTVNGPVTISSSR
jgi:hypothetical protein